MRRRQRTAGCGIAYAQPPIVRFTTADTISLTVVHVSSSGSATVPNVMMLWPLGRDREEDVEIDACVGQGLFGLLGDVLEQAGCSFPICRVNRLWFQSGMAASSISSSCSSSSSLASIVAILAGVGRRIYGRSWSLTHPTGSARKPWRHRNGNCSSRSLTAKRAPRCGALAITDAIPVAILPHPCRAITRISPASRYGWREGMAAIGR